MVIERSAGELGSTTPDREKLGHTALPVIFVHSLAGSASHWSFQLEHLENKRQAVAMQLAGHGSLSLQEGEICSIDSLAKGIDEMAEKLHWSRFVLVGHSLGATMCIAYAARNPEKVAGILLADPSGDARKIPARQTGSFLAELESDSYSKTIEAYYEQLLAGSLPLVRDKVMRDLRNTPQRTVVCIFKALLQYDPLTPLQRYAGPRLSVITHLNDAPFSLHKLLNDLPYVQMEGTGHWLQMDKPEEFNRILDQFLLSVSKEDADMANERTEK